jgi:hypothetical protein
MKKAVKKKSESAAHTSARALFRTFTELSDKVAAARPLLRGARIGRDPSADRFVVVHAGSQIEFVLVITADDAAKPAIECRRIDSSGASAGTIARFAFDERGTIVEATMPEWTGLRIDDKEGAWSVVAAVMWAAQGS